MNSTSFLGFPLVYHPATATLESTVHCVGENFRLHDAWMYRSCQFRDVCFHIQTKQFLYFPSQEEVMLQQILDTMAATSTNNSNATDWISISTVSYQQSSTSSPGSSAAVTNNTAHRKSMSLGTIYEPNSLTTTTSEPWFPDIVSSDPELQSELLSHGYYMLPNDVTLFPFQQSPFRADTWRDFFSMYTVLSMFGLEQKHLALLHYSTDDNQRLDKALLSDYIPVLGLQPNNLEDSRDASLRFTPDSDEKTIIAPLSNLVCSRYAVAGLGRLANTHRSNVVRLEDDENNSKEDAVLTHTVGRGSHMYEFRNYMLRNMNISIHKTTNPKKTIIIDHGSNKNAERDWSEQLRQRIQKSRELEGLDIHIVDATTVLPMNELAQLVATSMTYITFVGVERTMWSATFLPRGAVLIVLGRPTDVDPKDTNQEITRRSQQSDQLYLQTAGYFQVHWLHTSLTDPILFEQVLDIVRKQVGSNA